EGVGVLGRVAVVGAEAIGRAQRQRLRLLEAVLLDVLGGRAVAHLALHVDQARFLGAAAVAAARLLPAGHVAAGAVVVVLLVDLGERLPRVRVPRAAPELDRRLVALFARLHAEVARRAGLGGGRRNMLRCSKIRRADLLVEGAQPSLDGGIA